MFFSEREKQIYPSPFGVKYDPVDLHNRLEAASGSRLNDLLAIWWGDETSSGDRATTAIQLAGIARTGFNVKPFDQPDGRMDAEVLEALYHFLEWREGKG